MTWASPMLALVAAVIAVPALVILYFLKLRRQTREVSTTLLWKKAIQDLQANAPFQKLRKNLLLFLQLIVLGLILVGIAQPRSNAASNAGRKLVLLIDRSASMKSLDGSSTPGERTRLEQAKLDAVTLIESMQVPGLLEDDDKADQAMLIAFDSSAEILAPFTSDKDTLIRAINAIEASDALSSIDEAYRLAQAQRPAPSTAEPGSSDADDQPDTPAPDPFVFHLFSDGRIPDAELVRADYAEGFPTFEYHRVGMPESANLGIIALRAERDYDTPSTLSIFVGVQSTDTIARRVDAELLINGVRTAVRAVDLPPATRSDPLAETIEPSTGGVVFELDEPAGVTAVVRLATNADSNAKSDLLPTDNEGTLIIPPAKQAAVALVSSGNFYIREAISGLPLSRFETLSPSDYEQRRDDAEMGAFDLVIFDGYLPEPREDGTILDPGRYLILGRALTGPLGVEDLGVGAGSAIIDWRRTHPVLRDLTLDGLMLTETRRIEIPEDSGVVSLAESATGPAIFETSNADVRAICVPFDIGKTNWPFEVSFVVFLASAVDYLGTQTTVEVDQDEHQLIPGQVLSDRLPPGAAGVRVQLPTGETSDEIIPAPDGSILFGPLRRTGLYRVRWTGASGATDAVEGGRVSRLYAANLLDPNESNIRPPEHIALANQLVGADDEGRLRRVRDWWPWLLLAALGVLMFEWWIYNRKVYV